MGGAFKRGKWGFKEFDALGIHKALHATEMNDVLVSSLLSKVTDHIWGNLNCN